MIDLLLAPADAFRDLPRRMREHYYATAEPGALAAVHYDPLWWLRPDQRPPHHAEDFAILVFRGNRGTGKTEAAIYYFAGEILAGRFEEPCIVVGTSKNDPAALAKRFRKALGPRLAPTFEPSKGPAGMFMFPGPDGSRVEVPVFSAAAPEALPMNNFDGAFADDIAKWGPHAEACWGHLRACVRVGVARIVVATTVRGTRLLRRLLSGIMDGVVIRRPPVVNGKPDAWANRRNLNARQLARAVHEAKGTRFGREEHEDEDAASNSPFTGLNFDAPPIRVLEIRREDFEEIVAAVDPAGGKGGDHDEWGICAAGLRADGHVVMLEDASGELDDGEAGEGVLAICERWGATKIVVEENQGKRVRSVFVAAWQARRADKRGKLAAMPEIVPVVAKAGKVIRAGETKPLYLSGLVHHAVGMEPEERQAREWDPDAPKRPRVDDRIDAAVHAIHHLKKLAMVGDAWAPSPAEAQARAGGAPDPYRYQAPAPASDGWSVPSDPYQYQGSGDPLRYT